MKKSNWKSRKLWSVFLGIGIINSVYLLTVFFAPVSLGPNSLIVTSLLTGFLISAYIGGNVFQSYVNSKFWNGGNEKTKKEILKG